jgi:hypothetical protein
VTVSQLGDLFPDFLDLRIEAFTSFNKEFALFFSGFAQDKLSVQ